ncbi:hypothetical protein B1K54_33170 [Streptomyces sp. fd1-xmd]|nr:hypothetical protein B1K54_33170 [Streptomyces sp. fd1-xmd]
MARQRLTPDTPPAPRVAYGPARQAAHGAVLPAAVRFRRAGDPAEHQDREPAPARTRFPAGPAPAEPSRPRRIG